MKIKFKKINQSQYDVYVNGKKSKYYIQDHAREGRGGAMVIDGWVVWDDTEAITDPLSRIGDAKREAITYISSIKESKMKKSELKKIIKEVIKEASISASDYEAGEEMDAAMDLSGELNKGVELMAKTNKKIIDTWKKALKKSPIDFDEVLSLIQNQNEDDADFLTYAFLGDY